MLCSWKNSVLCERSRAKTRNFLSNGSGVYSSAALRLLQLFSLDRWFFEIPNRILHIHVDAFGLLVDISTFTHANSLSTVCSFRIFPFERRFRRSLGLFHWRLLFCDLIFSTHTWHFLEVFTVGWRHAGNKVSFKHALMSIITMFRCWRKEAQTTESFFYWASFRAYNALPYYAQPVICVHLEAIDCCITRRPICIVIMYWLYNSYSFSPVDALSRQPE